MLPPTLPIRTTRAGPALIWAALAMAQCSAV
jgi:hypothetical protein